MRSPPPPTRSEGLAYVFVAMLAAMVLAHAAGAPHDPVSPDIQLAEEMHR